MKFINTIGKAIYKVVFRHTIAREKAAEEYHQRMLARFAGDGIYDCLDELLEAERKAAAYDMTRTQQQACKAHDAEYEAWVQTQATIERIKRKATT